MQRFFQWLNKIPVIVFILVYVAFLITLLFLDNYLGLNGFLCVSGVAFAVVFLICLFIIYRIMQRKKENSYSFKDLCGDFTADLEIEFTYDHTRYLFMPENGRYYFKRIVAIDPFEYEILAEAQDASACIDASAVNGKKIAGLWPEIEDITVYR